MGEFDLVLANLEAAQIQAWADTLWAHVRPNGQLLVSGFLTAESDVVQRALAHAMRVVQHEDGWTAAVFIRADALVLERVRAAD
jgi:ribosomal protein L11 methylase PrmA